MTGWVKLHRSLLEWEWVTRPEILSVFVQCLLRANFEARNWQGIALQRGQFFTSSESFSRQTGLSRQSVRTALSKLQSSGELTIKSTNKGIIVTVCNFDTYNECENTSNQPANQQSTNDQPTINQQSTSNQPQRKKEKKERSEESSLAAAGKPASAGGISWSRETSWQGITEDDLAKWSEAYPACDITRQLAAMALWLESNPAKARKSNWRRFITSWLTRQQDKGGDIAGGYKPSVSTTSRSATPPAWLPDNWREIAVAIVGPEAANFTSHSEVPADYRYQFRLACRGEDQLPLSLDDDAA